MPNHDNWTLLAISTSKGEAILDDRTDSTDSASSTDIL